MSTASMDGLLAEANELLPETVEYRRRMHRRPELGLHLPETQATVLEAIDGLDLEIETGDECSWVVATLDSGTPGPTMLLRGDMDALPMPEDTGLPYASEIDGAMHACGHDAHTAMLASSAKVLAGRRDELTGKVVFMFQPGEEGFAGAKVMIDEGLLDGRNVTRAFAIHQSTSAPSGFVGTKPGPLLASADFFELTVTGKGGHASMPHFAVDPIPIACEMVGAFQTMITRKVEAFNPAVVTVAKIRAGTTTNVIPETAMMAGTIRSVSEKSRALVIAEMERIATHIALAHGATATLDVQTDGYPVTINDADAAAWVLDVAGRLVGDQAMEMPDPVMGAEDWSYVLQQVPGAMAFLGTCPPDIPLAESAPNHSNRMIIHEDAMAVGTALYAAVALDECAAP
ncbi:M20 metallopeptidase family protein [Actinospongicola halichondriae]|uniref:M20 metallopeptidase family protein n=1 Tax=Actinospongicola halichondriae TaxID=3236844 RepID=UPI003D39ACA9